MANTKIAKPTQKDYKHSVFTAAELIKKRKHDNAEALKQASNPNYIAKPYRKS